MNTSYRQPTSWTATIVRAALLVIIGAAAATYLLTHWNGGARLVGLSSQPAATVRPLAPTVPAPGADGVMTPPAATADPRIAILEQRLAAVEQANQRVAGSAGRADALLIAFAARRAIDRGVALGYLETLLVERFGATHEAAVATIVSASHRPIRLEELVARYDELGPTLRAAPADTGLWTRLRGQLASLVTIRRADAPSPRPTARYDRARSALQDGAVEIALAETMRLPGAGQAGDWAERARRYVAVHRALDEIETAALLGGGRGPIAPAAPLPEVEAPAHDQTIPIG